MTLYLRELNTNVTYIMLYTAYSGTVARFQLNKLTRMCNGKPRRYSRRIYSQYR